MGSIVIRLSIVDIRDVLQHYDRIKIYRSTEGATGAFYEVTEPETRLELSKFVTAYEFVDPNGDLDFWYKSSYFNEGSGAESAQTTAFQGTSDPLLDIITVQEVKDFYLFGVNLTDDTGKPYPPELYKHYIRAAVYTTERELGITLRSQVITSEAHDLIPADWADYMWVTTKNRPVASVEAVRLVLPPNSQVQEFTTTSLMLDSHTGVINIVPPSLDAGSLALFSGFGFMPWMRALSRRIPHAIQIDYTTGFLAAEGVPADIKHVVGMYAAIGPLNIAGDLIAGAGIASQSLSIDGLSQAISTTSSATNSGYGARILEYLKEIKGMTPKMRAAYRGVGLVVA